MPVCFRARQPQLVARLGTAEQPKVLLLWVKNSTSTSSSSSRISCSCVAHLTVAPSNRSVIRSVQSVSLLHCWPHSAPGSTDGRSRRSRNKRQAYTSDLMTSWPCHHIDVFYKV